MGKCLAQHLELQMESHLKLMKELSWVLQMAPLMVLMKSNLRVTCLDLDWDKKLVLHLDLLMVLWKEIKMALWIAEHSGSYLVHLMYTDEGIILSSTDGEVLGSTLGALDGFILGLNEGTELGSLDGSSEGCST